MPLASKFAIVAHCLYKMDGGDEKKGGGGIVVGLHPKEEIMRVLMGNQSKAFTDLQIKIGKRGGGVMKREM